MPSPPRQAQTAEKCPESRSKCRKSAEIGADDAIATVQIGQNLDPGTLRGEQRGDIGALHVADLDQDLPAGVQMRPRARRDGPIGAQPSPPSVSAPSGSHSRTSGDSPAISATEI